MKKKISFLLVLTMVLMLIPAFSVTAFAANATITTPLDFTQKAVRDAYANGVNGVQYKTTKQTDYWGDEYEVTELILSGATIDCSGNAEVDSAFGIKLPEGTDVILADGTVNTIIAGPGKSASYGLSIVDEDGYACSLCLYPENETTTNRGKLILKSGTVSKSDAGYGLYVGWLNIENVILEATGTKSGINIDGTHSYGDIDAKKASISAVALSSTSPSAIVCSSDITLDLESTVSACNVNATSSAAISVGRLRAKGATVTGTKIESKNSVSIIQNGTTPVTISYPDICSMGGKNYKSLEDAVNAVGNKNGTITLLQHIELPGTVYICEGEITIDLNGFFILPYEDMDDHAFYISEGTKLTIQDSQSSKVNTVYLNDDGFAVAGNGGTGTTPINVNGGGIGGFDTDSSYGGAIYSFGTLIVNAGNIIGNKAECGAAIYCCDESELEINGGIISNNYSEDYGGAIYLYGAKAKITDGILEHNTCDWYGGAIYAKSWTDLTITGGKIGNNNAKGGAGVYFESDSTLKMSGGTIQDNSATQYGGGVYARGSVILGGSSQLIFDNSVKSGATSIANNLYLTGNGAVAIGTGTGKDGNGVALPGVGLQVGVTTDVVNTVIGAYVITDLSDTDIHSYFINDAGTPNVEDFVVEGKHVAGIRVPDYKLILSSGKVYKNTVAPGNETAVLGLEYNSDEQRWEMTDWEFVTTAAPAMEFADGSANLYTDSQCQILSCATDENAVAVTANEINIEVDGGYLVFYGPQTDAALECTDLNITGNGMLALGAANKTIKTDTRPVVKALDSFPLFGGGEKLEWNATLKTYVSKGTSTPVTEAFLMHLVNFSSGITSDEYDYSDFEIGQKYFTGRDYIFDGWYLEGDYTLTRLNSEAESDIYSEYIAKWTNGINTVVMKRLNFNDDDIAEEYSSGKDGISWNAGSRTLTLNNASIESTEISDLNILRDLVQLPDDSRVYLVGENSLFLATDYSHALYGSDLYIYGSGILNVHGVMGIYSDFDLTISGAHINVISDAYGVDAGNGKLRIINDAIVSVTTDERNTAFDSLRGIYAQSMTGGKAYDDDGVMEFTSGKTMEIRALSDTTPVVLIGTPVQSDSDSSSSTQNITASATDVSGTTLNATATVNGSNASVTIKDADLNKLAAQAVTPSGNPTGITLDLSSLGNGVTGVTLDTSTVNKINSIIKDKNNDIEQLDIKLPNATIMLYKEALASIASQAKGGKIEISLNQGTKAEGTMSDAQKETVKGFSNPLVIDAKVSSGGEAISDFGGGTVAIRVAYKSNKALIGWFVDKIGKKSGVPCIYDGETAVIVAGHFSHYVIEEGGVAFNDVDQEAYYYDAVKWAAEKAITSGKTEATFAPNDTCTRAEFVTFLWRAAGQPVVNYLMPFTDIDENAYYAEALRWAASEKIVAGTTETTFNPKGSITRAQAVAYLWRYAGAIPFANMTANGPAPSPFTDVSNKAYYYNAVLWAKAQGITSGKTETTFGPSDNCLRGQMVCFLYNYFNK